MNTKLHIQTDAKWLAKAAMLAVLGWLVSMSFATAGDFTATDNPTSNYQAVKNFNDETQTSEQVPTQQKEPREAQDFMASGSPLSKATTNDKSEVNLLKVTDSGKQCSSTGNQTQGSQSCLEKLENGHFAESTSDWENFGDETKKQTVIKYYDAEGNQLDEKTVRIKTLYRRDEKQSNKTKEREYYDIIDAPTKGLTVRDLIVKEYKRNEELSKTTWAHYREIGTQKAGLVHHAVLYYKNNQLSSGYADKYENGRVVDTLLNYNPSKNPNLRMEVTGAQKWVGWINRLIQDPKTTAV